MPFRYNGYWSRYDGACGSVHGSGDKHTVRVVEVNDLSGYGMGLLLFGL